jgi:hypothetical protein
LRITVRVCVVARSKADWTWLFEIEHTGGVSLRLAPMFAITNRLRRGDRMRAHYGRLDV